MDRDRLRAAPLIELHGVTLALLADVADRLVGSSVPARRDWIADAALCFGLCGTLGAGKTQLARELARACGVEPEGVTSPTFTLLKSYVTRMGPLHHLDAYRISDEDEFLDLGVEELWSTPVSWTFVEWADRFQTVMPWETVWVQIEPESIDDVGVDFEIAASVPRKLRFWCDEPVRASWLVESLSFFKRA